MSQTSLHVLMTGAGAPGAAGILKCLKEQPAWKITLADANPEAYGRYLSPDFETIPVAIAPLFAERLLEICIQRKIDVVLPLVTKELIPLAQYKEKFEKAGVRIPLSQTASLEIANNKSRLYQFLDWRGITVPSFHVVETLEQFIEAVHVLGYPEKETCFKPSVSNGSRGFRILSEKTNELDLLFNQKPGSVYMRLQEAMRILSTGAFPELLVSEYLPGEEYSVDCLANNGEVVLAIPRLRKRMVNGISVAGEIVKEDSIIDYCVSIISSLQLHGNIGIQVKRSISGQFLILEINPRVQGSIAACLGAGVNLPVLAVKQEMGLPLEKASLEVKWGTRFSRYWEDVFY